MEAVLRRESISLGACRYLILAYASTQRDPDFKIKSFDLFLKPLLDSRYLYRSSRGY